MPRQARQKAESGYYHIMNRGNERRSIFMDDEDRQKYLALFNPETQTFSDIEPPPKSKAEITHLVEKEFKKAWRVQGDGPCGPQVKQLEIA